MIISKLKAGLIAAAITTAFFIFSANLTAQPHDRKPGDDKGPIEKFKFDDEQKKELEKLKKEHMEIMKSIEEENHKLHEELFSLLKDNQPDKTKADSLITLLAENKKKAGLEMFSHLTDIKSLCKTDEQKKLFSEFVDDIGKIPQSPPDMHPPHMQPPCMHQPPPPPPHDK